MSLSNTLSFEDHVHRVLQCKIKVKDSLFDLIDAVSEAYINSEDQQRELSTRISISQTMIAKYNRIANSKIIQMNKSKVPSVFSSLYEICLLEKEYDDNKEAAKQFIQPLPKDISTYFVTNKINPNTETAEITFLLEKTRRQLRELKKNTKEDFLNSKSGAVGYNTDGDYEKLDQLIDKGVKVKTILLSPSSSQLTKWANEGVFENDIRDEFPLHHVRGTTNNGSICCFIEVDNSNLDVGIKLLNTFGFKYRQTFFPASNKNTCLLFGERGRSSRILYEETNNIFDIAEMVGDGPYLSLYKDAKREHWKSIELA